MYDEKELSEEYDAEFSEEKMKIAEGSIDKPYKKLLLYGHLLPPFMRSRDYAVTDVFWDKKEMYFKKKRALHYNRYTKKGYVTKMSLIEFIKNILFITK
jgi:hypothetical protein